VSLKDVVVVVAICVKFEHPAPWQRCTLYPVTPTLSVEAVQVRLICVFDADVAARFAGTDGGTVSTTGADPDPDMEPQPESAKPRPQTREK